MSPESSTPSEEPDTSSAPEGAAEEVPPARRGVRWRAAAAYERMPSAYRRLPIRWRLAGGSAVLTLIILTAFAVIVGLLTTRQIRSDFHDRVRNTASELSREMQVTVTPEGVECVGPDLNDFGSPDDAHIRVLTGDGILLCETRNSPDLGFPRNDALERSGYRVESRVIRAGHGGEAVLQYARPESEASRTINKVKFFLLFGILGGTGLALLAGLWTARRAMSPIAELTWTAREIERTRDPSLEMPQPEGDDEVAELARTLDEMLGALDAARAETEHALERQRAFVADASHELRTPLTSVLANLEILAERLEGEEKEAAESALRSSRRMRRLVADLLLLARHDSGRRADRRPVDLGEILVDAASELGPVAQDHILTVDAVPVTVQGARDELHRLALNLMENAVNHTPPGTNVRAELVRHDRSVDLIVSDDGPGIPSDIEARIFERFVRGRGDRGGSSGLGLAIVRAVAQAHGGSVRLERPKADPAHPGARFVVEIPLTSAPAEPPVPSLASLYS